MQSCGLLQVKRLMNGLSQRMCAWPEFQLVAISACASGDPFISLNVKGCLTRCVYENLAAAFTLVLYSSFATYYSHTHSVHHVN
jgi:uncharacterized membrane protein